MQDNPQSEEFNSQIEAELDSWITARLAGRKQISSLANLNSQTVNLTALAQDLLSLTESMQPDQDFVLNLEAKLRCQVLKREGLRESHSSLADLST